MSNAGMGTRGMSAGDWTRMQRLRGAKPYGVVSGGQPNVGASNVVGFALNSDINPVPKVSQPHGTALLIKPAVGTSKIRRTAGQWTDFVASGHADYYTRSQTAPNNPAVVKTLNLVGAGTNDGGSGWANKPANPGANQVNRMKIIS